MQCNNNNKRINCVDYFMQQHKSRRRKQIKLLMRLDSVLGRLFFVVVVVFVVAVVFVVLFVVVLFGGEHT